MNNAMKTSNTITYYPSAILDELSCTTLFNRLYYPMTSKQTCHIMYYRAGSRAPDDSSETGWERGRSSLTIYELIYRRKPRKPI